MIFDLERQEHGDWFSYFRSHYDQATGEIIYEDSEPDAAEFCLRSMALFFEERRKHRKRESKMVLNPTTRSMERVTYLVDLSPEEAEKENIDAWDFAILDWRNVYAAENKPLECNAENKMRLMKLPEFVRFVNRVFLILSGDASIRETSEKNLQSG